MIIVNLDFFIIHPRLFQPRNRLIRAGISSPRISDEKTRRLRSSIGNATFTPLRRCDSRRAIATSSAARPSSPEHSGEPHFQ